MQEEGGRRMKTSEQIEAFMGLIRGAPIEYEAAREKISDADKEIQDILHWLENNEVPPVDGEGAMLILGVIGMVRRDRRAAKDTETALRPVAKWAKTHKSTMDGLGQLLGDVRKAEKGTGDRHYTDRTDIMKEIFGEEDE